MLSADSIPTLLVKPGETVDFVIESNEPNKLTMHNQNLWRYVESFACEGHDEDETLSICSLTIKNGNHIPTTFSIFKEENGCDPIVKTYISIEEES